MRTMASLFLLGSALAATTGVAAGQVGAGGTTNVMTNPYTNPYLNPYLNPGLSNGTVNKNDALMYLWTAQQQPGGLLAQNPAAAAARRSRGPVTESPGLATMRPGGGASRYFNPSRPAPANRFVGHYQRTNRYFGSNGR